MASDEEDRSLAGTKLCQGTAAAAAAVFAFALAFFESSSAAAAPAAAFSSRQRQPHGHSVPRRRVASPRPPAFLSPAELSLVPRVSHFLVAAAVCYYAGGVRQIETASPRERRWAQPVKRYVHQEAGFGISSLATFQRER